MPATRYLEVVRQLQNEPLSDLSVSRPRSRLKWGVAVPNDEDHTIYVWLDALTNYLTVAGWPHASTEAAWPADLHVIGKDIIRFHIIYWPAFLMAADLPLPKTVLAHAHWTMDHFKMSKSRGNVVDPVLSMKLFGADAMRYYLMRIGGSLTTDTSESKPGPKLGCGSPAQNFLFLLHRLLAGALARRLSQRPCRTVG